MTKFIIKGAVYYSDDNDILLVPHYTGDFIAVDCDEYKTEDRIKEEYPEGWFEEYAISYKIYDGVKYYLAEYGPYHTDDFILLSDLSSLEHFDEEIEFD